MIRPGTNVEEGDAAGTQTLAIDTGTWFVVGMTQKGPTDSAQLVESPAAATDKYGDDVAYSQTKATVLGALAQGASRVYVARVVGPAALAAKVDLLNATVSTVTVSAASVGDWANGMKIDVLTPTEDSTIPVGSFVMVVKDASGVELERTLPLADTTALVAWSATSDYVRVTETAGSGNPVHVANATLAAGTDDRASVTDAQRVAALALFTDDLGPGQVSVPGATTLTVHQGVAQHCADHDGKRFGYLDAPAVADTSPASKATVKAAAAAVRALGALSKHVAMFSPSALVAGPAGTRVAIPYSAIQAGLTARIDAAGNPNIAPAGKNGRATTALGLTLTWSEADRQELNEAGVNVARIVKGEVRTYGFRTLADRAKYPLHWQASNLRLDMAIAARADSILEEHVFAEIDPKGIEASTYGGELSAMLDEYVGMGAIWPLRDGRKFAVITDSTVNTPTTIADGQLKATMTYARSSFAEAVTLEVVKAAISA